MTNSDEIIKWFTDNGDNTHNITYDLTDKSVIIDLGGYEGVWAQQMIEKYNPNVYGGAFKVTRDLSNKFPDRVKNTPISEQALVGIAIGAALRGNVSIVEIMFGDFTTLAFDQLLQHVSKFTLMYGIKLEIPFILSSSLTSEKVAFP
jgi:pyruvate/2-oxoglutarate/acetoin dehydrogenase E1 component